MNNNNNNNNSAIDWNEVAKSNKGTRTSDNQPCGNIIAEHDDSIIISEGVINVHEYVVPKSKVGYYNGSEVYLIIPYNILSIFKV